MPQPRPSLSNFIDAISVTYNPSQDSHHSFIKQFSSYALRSSPCALNISMGFVQSDLLLVCSSCPLGSGSGPLRKI